MAEGVNRIQYVLEYITVVLRGVKHCFIDPSQNLRIKFVMEIDDSSDLSVACELQNQLQSCLRFRVVSLQNIYLLTLFRQTF